MCKRVYPVLQALPRHYFKLLVASKWATLKQKKTLQFWGEGSFCKCVFHWWSLYFSLVYDEHVAKEEAWLLIKGESIRGWGGGWACSPLSNDAAALSVYSKLPSVAGGPSFTLLKRLHLHKSSWDLRAPSAAHSVFKSYIVTDIKPQNDLYNIVRQLGVVWVLALRVEPPNLQRL